MKNFQTVSLVLKFKKFISTQNSFPFQCFQSKTFLLQKGDAAFIRRVCIEILNALMARYTRGQTQWQRI